MDMCVHIYFLNRALLNANHALLFTFFYSKERDTSGTRRHHCSDLQSYTIMDEKYNVVTVKVFKR